MKRLVIVRHAKAVKGAARMRDLDRPLTARGEADARELGRRLGRRGVHPDAIVTSPAERARATAKLIARELDFPWSEIRAEARVYLAQPEVLLEIVREFEDRAESVLLVGHNNGLSEFAEDLARDFHESLPTCAAVALDLPADTWRGVRPGKAGLLFYHNPKQTR